MSQDPAIEVHGIVKRYGQVTALNGVDFDLHAGEVVALVGDNGAGKSTLVKVLAGVIRPDAGTVLVDGEPANFRSPRDARSRGIETVYQNLALAEPLDVASNLFLGRELRCTGVRGLLRRLDTKATQREASKALADLHISLRSPSQLVETLSGGQRQAVAIARAVSWGKRVTIMDEPTAALGVQQAAVVLDLIRRVRDTGCSVVLISHNLPDVFAVADRIQVLRLGRRIGTARPSTDDMEAVVAMITGASLPDVERRMGHDRPEVRGIGDGP